MNQDQSPRVQHYGRKSVLASLWALTLFIALQFAVTVVITYAQNECAIGCHQDFVLCQQAAGGDPILEAMCQDQYDDCIDGCLAQ